MIVDLISFCLICKTTLFKCFWLWMNSLCPDWTHLSLILLFDTVLKVYKSNVFFFCNDLIIEHTDQTLCITVIWGNEYIYVNLKHFTHDNIYRQKLKICQHNMYIIFMWHILERNGVSSKQFNKCFPQF